MFMIKFMKQLKKKFAVFDIDGTLFRSSLLIELVEALIKEGYFPAKARKMYEEEYNLWLDRRGSYNAYIEKVVEAYVQNIRGLYLKDIQEVAERILLFHHSRIYRYTRDLIKKLQKEDYFMLAISNSPYNIVEQFARKWGFQKVYAQYYEVGGEGRFTGKVQFLDFILRKDRVLERAIEKENLKLTGSIGVGDSDADAAFLNMVSRPIAFNPSSGLYRMARRKRWKIVVERKDVIYTIK